MNKTTKIALIFIIILAVILRTYKLDSVPPSISWDEAAVGYNAYTLANFGKDEYGKSYPLFFKSFGDDKHPIHVYLTALSVKFLGLSEESIRLPAVIFGVLNVLVIFFLTKIISGSNLAGIFASFMMTISPYSIHFSRFNHEANFVTFSFMLGLLLFFLSFKRNGFLLPLSVLSFGISVITYHPAKIVVPIVGFILVIFYIKEIKKDKNFFASILIIVFFLTMIISNPQLLGLSRVGQTIQGKKDIEKTKLFQLTKNEILGRIDLILTQYSWHFSPKYLFISGDKNPRLSSSQKSGQFYKIDAIFLVIGLIYLMFKRSKKGFLLLTWATVSPLPAAMVAEAPHAARAIFMMGSFNIIAALGLYWITTFFRRPIIKWSFITLSILIMIIFLTGYLNYYYNEYVKRYAIDWQYGMKQIVEYVKDHPEYSHVFTTDARSQPYIFFLFYLKTPLTEYLNTVSYNRSEENKSYNTVAYFGRYYFGGWDPIESIPNPGVLYILTPSQYEGLRYRLAFDIKNLIYYPNGNSAFYLVSVR